MSEPQRANPRRAEDASADGSTDSVSHDMFAFLHGRSAPIVTRWTYRADDPFAVALAVRTRHDRWVEWLVARDLVVDGLSAPTGIGDVRLVPRRAAGHDIVAIEIRSNDGEAVLEVDRALLRGFVEASTEIVALGDESDRMDLDGEIARMSA